MNFLYPQFLFALSAIAIPIIVHLFNFRRFKTVYFSNTRFLRQVKIETQSKSQLRHLLVLLSRILAIVCLVLAFAQPYLKSKNHPLEAGEKAISVFVDNSFSMEARGGEGTLLDEAKKKAAEIALAYKPFDKFQLLTDDFEARHQRLVNKEEFNEMTDEIKISPSSRTLSAIYARQKDAVSSFSKGAKTLFIISDFQKTVSDVQDIKPDSSLNVYFIPLAAAQTANVYLDSCWFTTPVRQLNETQELLVRVRNTSKEPVENIPAKLTINGKQKALASINIEAGGTAEIKMSFTISEPGIHQAELSITDYPITYDDVFYFSFDVAPNIPVLCINGDKQSKSINAVFGKDSLFILTNNPESMLNYAAFANYRLIIFNELNNISSGLSQEIRRFVENGGGLLIIPSQHIDYGSYNELLSSFKAAAVAGFDSNATKVSQINFENELYRNVFGKISENIDLPVVSKHYNFVKNQQSNEEYLLRLSSGNSFLSKYAVGKGKLYVSAVPLSGNWSNFPRHAIFVPTLYNIAMFSKPPRKIVLHHR